MRPRIPRFRLRTLLVAIALVANLLGVGVWYFTPRVGLRLVPDRTSWSVGEYPRGVVEITNRAPRGHSISFISTSVIGLDLIVTDTSGRVVSDGPSLFMDSPNPSTPPTFLLGPGATYSPAVGLLRTVYTPHLAPGTYAVKAVYDHGGVPVRSNKITIRLLPRRSP